MTGPRDLKCDHLENAIPNWERVVKPQVSCKELSKQMLCCWWNSFEKLCVTENKNLCWPFDFRISIYISHFCNYTVRELHNSRVLEKCNDIFAFAFAVLLKFWVVPALSAAVPVNIVLIGEFSLKRVELF